ncbi:hypothetical protein [cf. Phormidesmis sp. LEGE 11477]|uniref:hypothetical protein n=1 Tax=cf. Phormidesmis sp. LEGE 11477 TaxID=1828680 RepID=UPI001881FDB3|nr:hypothetical protein [cf. Phormidesmis sp. LEGE 11477]MBE9063831.1 hypothetical protein [cf. Phormidesmis sp. LEGE 11477]
MPLDSGSEKVTNLSEAKSVRRDGAVDDRPITESKLVELFDQFIPPLSGQIEALSGKVTRLENSISLMQTQFEAVRNGDAGDAALHVTADESAAVDIASMQAKIHKEDWYIYTTSHLAEKLEISINEAVKLIKQCSLKGDPKYHTGISTGRCETSIAHKYSEAAFVRLGQALKLGRPKL